MCSAGRIPCNNMTIERLAQRSKIYPRGIGKTMQISLLEPLLQARTGVCADNWMNKYVTCLRSASSQSWIGKCPTTVLQLQHLSKIVQAELVTPKKTSAMPPCPQLSGSSCEGRRAANPAEMQFLKAAAPL